MSNLHTPEGRLAAAEFLGPDGYNTAMAAHFAAETIATVNGYPLRWVDTRFGRLCQVVHSDKAFRTVEEATAHARSLSAYQDRSYATRKVSMREDAILIAAIRLWQAIQYGSVVLVDSRGNPMGLDAFDDVASNAYLFEPLNAAEVDDMGVEVFKLDPWLDEEERAAAQS